MTNEKTSIQLGLVFLLQGKFWQMLDEDFDREVNEESIHDIFVLVFDELTIDQLLNILNKINSEQVDRLKRMLPEINTK